jgi:predicted dehydrogenase/nucleoside-diphosphate-sugar epimerase
VIGCGAVAREFHLPVLAGHEEVRLVALVDRDLARARELAERYAIPGAFGDVDEIEQGSIDAALVTTPPQHHAPCAIELARRGIHVFVEKPMALGYDDAAAMVRAAEEAGVVLAVGLFRRLLPSTRLLRAAIESRMLGRPLSFDVEEGGVYGWPLTTLAGMRKESAGGGVLIDAGTHTLDRLLFLFPGPAEILEYRHDALGGIEADCFLRLRLRDGPDPIEGCVTLSRTRTLRNSVRIECERGALEVRSGEQYRISIRPHELELFDRMRNEVRGYDLTLGWAGEADAPGFEAFRTEIDDWIGAIRSGRGPQLSGRSALPTVKLIEDCYRSARSIVEPWVEEGLRRVREAPSRERGAQRRVLVTGASGFIGCRVAEILRLREGWDVRALVHDPSKVSRLARLDVEMMAGDLRSRADLRRAVEGCDTVVHCAIGTSWRSREVFAVTVGGTRQVAEAARAARVRRFVHLSTIAVYDRTIEGVIDESSPVRPPKGDTYSQSKAAAERAIARAAEKGLPAIVLRLANVYGPFSQIFTVRPIRDLAEGRLVLVGCADFPSNTVYIDNVVEAIVRAIEAPSVENCGAIFTIGADDGFTWREYYTYFANALGVEVPVISADPGAAGHNGLGRRGRGRPTGWLAGCLEVARSAEFRALGRKVLDTEPVGRLPRALLERVPSLRRGLRRWLNVDGPLIYRRAGASRGDLHEVRAFAARVSSDKARRVLGYVPLVPRSRALELTLDWLRHARLIVPVSEAKKGAGT